MLAAADTFRAAAAEQLGEWAKRADVAMVRHNEGADPAAVVFDAIASYKAKGCDLLLCDTAGRLHNKANLMNELGKIRRVIARELPETPCETLLVLDAVTGQNAVAAGARVCGGVPARRRDPHQARRHGKGRRGDLHLRDAQRARALRRRRRRD